MLGELRIVDLGVIGEAVLEPGAGFTAVTGETGAGKTMIVTGLSLLCGAKADPRLVRAGATRALVEGRWALDAYSAAALEDLGADIEATDGATGGPEVLTVRQVGASRSRLSIGGVPVPLAQGAELVGEWVTIHGQMEQVRLGSPERQREVLDEFASAALGDSLDRYRADYKARSVAQAELDRLRAQAQERLRELDLLRFGLEEIGRADPQPGEDVVLGAQAVKLQAVDDLRLAARQAQVALAGDDDAYDVPDAMGLVATARKALGDAGDSDAQLGALGDRLADAASVLADVAMELATYLDGLEADPLRLEWIAGRQAELQSLSRKYGGSVDAVLAWARQASQRMVDLDASEEHIEELTASVEALDASLDGLASAISQARRDAGERLSGLVAGELAALAMPNARLEFQVTPLPALGPHGGDQVALMFSANPGAAPGPLGKVASGGELSRVRLALEVVLASGASGSRQTFVFDEVDAGVGGSVALEIGRRLQRLAEHAQVIVVTHLAQVAAFADRQYVVAKSDDGQVTTSGVHEVTGDERLDVLARMMGGLDDSESARAHAAELVALAAAGK